MTTGDGTKKPLTRMARDVLLQMPIGEKLYYSAGQGEWHTEATVSMLPKEISVFRVRLEEIHHRGEKFNHQVGDVIGAAGYELYELPTTIQ